MNRPIEPAWRVLFSVFLVLAGMLIGRNLPLRLEKQRNGTAVNTKAHAVVPSKKTPDNATLSNLFVRASCALDTNAAPKNITRDDLASAIRAACAIKNPFARRCALFDIARTMSAADIPGILKMAAKMDVREDEKTDFIKIMVLHWATENPAAAMSFALGEKYQSIPPLLGDVFDGWMKADHVGAMAWLNAQPADEKSTIAMQWADVDVISAVSLIQSFSDNTQKSEMMRDIAWQWACKDPVASAAYAQQLPCGQWTSQMIANVASGWAYSDAQAAWAWAQTLPAGQDRKSAMQSVIYSMTGSDPAAAIRAVSNMPEGLARRQAIAVVAEVMARTAPGQAVDWALALPDGDTRNSTIFSMVNQLGRNASESDAVTKLLDALPAGPLRDKGLVTLAQTVGNTDPQKAITLITLLPEDTPQRQEVLVGAIEQWAMDDPVNAAAYAMQLPDNDNRNHVFGTIAENWAKYDPLAAVTWAAGLPNAASSSALCCALPDWEKVDPAAAFAYIDGLPEGEQKNTAVLMAVGINSSQNMEMVANWVANSQWGAGNLQRDAASDVAATWEERDPAAVEKWIATLPSGKAQDGARMGQSIYFSQSGAFVMALKYAALIQDAELQKTTINGIKEQSGK